MAYIRDSATASDTSDVSSHTGSVPIHQTGDVLLWYVEKDTNTGGDLSTPAGWSAVVHESADAALRTALFYKVAASSSESAPTTTSSDTDAFISIMVSVADADVSDVIEAYAASSPGASISSSDAVTVTTATDDCLILHFIAVDGNALFPTNHEMGTQLVRVDGNNSVSACVAYTVQRTAGATETPAYAWGFASRSSATTVAINNATGGKIPAYSSLSSPPTTTIASLDRSVSTSVVNNYSYKTSVDVATIGSFDTRYTAGTGQSGTGLVAVIKSLLINTAASSDSTKFHTNQIDFNSSVDLSGLVGIAFTMQSIRNAYIEIFPLTYGSVVLAFADSNNYYRAFEITGSNASPEPFGWSTAVINVNQSTTAYAESANTPNVSAITKILPCFRPKATNVGAYFAEIQKINTLIIYGGDTLHPIGAEDIAILGSGQKLKTIYLTGSSSLLSYTPIQVGGGEKVVFGLSNSSLQFPVSNDKTNRKVSFQGSANDLGITYYGVSGDTISHTNSVISSNSPWYFTIHASATSAATWDFSGLTVVGALVTLRNVTTYNSMNFVDCQSINANSCSLSNCSIIGLTDSDDFVVNEDSTIDNCTFDTTDLAASEYMCSVDDPSIFSDCTFNGSSTTGHAIRITATGSYSFSGNIFSGYGNDDTNSAAIFNDSGGLVTLNIVDNGNTPTVKNGTSASTVINNSKTITISIKDETNNEVEDARVAVYKTSDMTEIMNSLTSASGVATTTFNYSTDTPVIIRVRKSSDTPKYVPVQTSGTITNNGLDATITFISDSIAESTVNSTIGDDFTINTTTKTIRHVVGETPIYTVREFYTWLMDYFDDSGLMDDAIAMTAQTSSEYTLVNGWFLDDTSTKFLKSGAIQTSGWTHPANTNGIRILTLATITGVDDNDLGEAVVGETSNDSGILLDYNTTLKKLWVRTDASDDDFSNTSENINVNGSLAGAMNGSSAVTGNTTWSNIFTLGTLVSGTTLDIYQNDQQITPWWSSGHIDLLVKVMEANVEIDAGYLTILARKYATLYDHIVINASSGRNPVPLAAFDDLNNQTSEVTVSGYNDISLTFGYISYDLNNTNGYQPYDLTIDCAGRTIAQVYEYLKYITRSGSSLTLNGVNGEYYVAVGDLRLSYSSIANGPFVETSAISSSSGGSGYITSVNTDDDVLVIRNVHGTFEDTDTITSGSTTATINGTPDSIASSKQAPFGTFAGGKFFGARGVLLTNVHANDGNNYQLIDSTNTTQSPPLSIPIMVDAVESGDRVSVFRADGNTNNVLKTYIVSHATANASPSTSWRATTSIPADTPSTGIIRLVKSTNGAEERIAYTGWTDDTFTLSTAHAGGYGSGDTAYVPYLDQEATGTSVSTSITYVTDRYVTVRVRRKGIVPFIIKKQLTSSGMSVSAIRTEDSIVSD